MNKLSLTKGIRAAGFFAVLLWLGLPGGGNLWPILLVALVPLLYLLRIESTTKRFFLGLLAGFFHFVLQIYWIVVVLGRYGGLPWFFSYPALILLCIYMAFYIACFVVLGGGIWKRWGLGTAIWLLPLCWVGFDWLRSVLFSGFPWMDLGYGMWQVPLLIQAADLLGHHGITALLVLCNCLLFALLQKNERIASWWHLVGVALCLLSVIIYGHLRGAQMTENIDAAPKAIFGVVQGNIDQSRKWSPEEQESTVSTYLSLTEQLLAQKENPQVVVWPETALPFFPQRNPLIHALQRLAVGENVALLTGSPWFEVEGEGDNRKTHFYNSSFLVEPTGAIGTRYFKSHLVPFGEYVPMKKLLPFLAPLVEAVGDFTAGSINQPLTTGTINCGVLICFESIFPAIARQWVDVGANVLVNLTNDAWYGRTSAPSQSMAMSVFRAVETRRSLVRAANTGISGFVDPLGRVSQSSDIFTPWARSDNIALIDTISLHSRIGYLFGPLCSLFIAAVLILLLVQRRGVPKYVHRR